MTIIKDTIYYIKYYEQILPEIFDGWLKYQGAINKNNRINGVLKLELEEEGLANELNFFLYCINHYL